MTRIRDDPDFGKSSYGVGPSLAMRILEARKSTPYGVFDSIQQINNVSGVGPDTMHDILYSFRTHASTDINHIMNYDLIVEIEGVTSGPFLEVDALESTSGVIVFANGDDVITHKRPGRTKYSNIILRRGFTGPGGGVSFGPDGTFHEPLWRLAAGSTGSQAKKRITMAATILGV